ncbi:MAG: hypothetical protein MUP16_09445, partial [Sedimentisphaerales bacterium]|nr:hypothetical protein [Sedimentisphaerales bacterium]
MKFELSQLPDMSIRIAMLRILLDALILYIARCYWLRRQAALEKTFSSHQIPVDKYFAETLKKVPEDNATRYGSPICISSNRDCRITFLRIRIILSDSMIDDKFQTGAYISVEGMGDYGYINLSLPMIITFMTGASSKDASCTVRSDDGTGLLFMDQRDTEKRAGTFRIGTYCVVAMPLSQAGANVKVSLPISTGPFASGLPMTKPRDLTCMLPDTDDATMLYFPYFPSVEKMELIINNLPKSFSFDPLGQSPHPEYYSDKECRWISGNSAGSRPHSSVSSRLTQGIGEERLQISRIKDGIGIGIWT